MSANEAPLSDITELFRREVSIRLIDWFLTDADPDTYYRKTVISEQSGVDIESVRKQLGSSGFDGLLDIYGIISISNREVEMPRYTVADTAVVNHLRRLRKSGYTPSKLHDFFATSAKRTLTNLFLIWADPTVTYTRTGIKNSFNVSYSGVNKNIDTYVQAGIVDAKKTGRSIEYTMNTDSDLRRIIIELNDVLMDHMLQ